jgi:type VI secretion system secreted protein VgrG
MPRIFTAHTPLGPEALKFRRLSGDEAVARLFEFRLECLSPSPALTLNDLLGQDITVEIETQGPGRRYLNGQVSRFALTGREGRYHRYEATLRPWLWYLTRRADCRIFQQQTVPQILDAVFAFYGFPVKKRLTGRYRPWDYCVQYRESDFNFVSRLMEHEGIYYYFEHALGVHTLVLADSLAAHDPFPGYASLPYYPPELTGIPDEEHVSAWRPAEAVSSGRYRYDDYDFTKPAADLMEATRDPKGHPHDGYEVYDYPGEYTELEHGERYVRLRLEALAAERQRAVGDSDARGLAPGYLVTLTRCPRATENREYLVLGASYAFEENPYVTGGQEDGTTYSVAFTAQPSAVTYRPARLTPKPTVGGPQTAVVVGPKGEEIWTDQYGRVKVQFHWDRLGAKDENSSCWVRVSSPWAGSHFGAVSLPRLGQEVIVDFLEGDPDQPIITGRVYNAQQMPPWALPAHATQSGILTRSSQGGTGANANALRFEDKAGQEQVWLHAERNQDIEVEHDETHWVGNDRAKTKVVPIVTTAFAGIEGGKRLIKV